MCSDENYCPSPDRSGNPFMFFLLKKHKRLERIAGNCSKKIMKKGELHEAVRL